MEIHQSSIIDKAAKLGKNVKIGPFCIIGPNVVLGDNVELKSHVVIEGHTEIGDNTVIYPFASIGHAPQDLKYSGEASTVVIGKNNLIREYVTIQPGTKAGGMQTIIGDNNLLMLGTHIAHDCIVGNNCIFANNATLGGHVHVGNGAVFGGLSAVRQFVKIGIGAMVGGVTGVRKDVLPYVTVSGNNAFIEGINIVGMKRTGFSLEEIRELQESINILFDSKDRVMADRVKSISAKFKNNKSIEALLNFIEKQDSQLGYCAPLAT